ncbi:hypothetical protein ABB37_08554 [Leptomonas pyrrhocoris]|uniref:Uncharacterized protein n=1 Tax=Leptomonas pyrrhocoris TaxID=157538 RepID=A0A0N0DS15_LEPPY|nr:hypothetical protein ABB37_08554 [Leptomonas pyrrhocoris]XP_015653687.1 hypothetical protein ABB37_08554 [Leptomonas pyrrhocoris]KPA75247.1 hypothetical protein ABB37_08554 [Leptomonas pyrrhocoris]KPA75248.1 hypothetical protein ABB37_08554 [Leptomonas pyrrhocoris]|eukprot:XP_015653686.1 hypothetical protein ABB37_08554 [Leptomonas pyrrhocoris]
MGCVTSSKKDVEAVPSGEVKALSMDMKTRFANVDAEVLGDYKDEAMAELMFVYGRSANIYIIKTPPFHPASLHERKEEEAKNEGEEDKEYPQEETKEEPVKEVRWAIFNDSKDDAKFETTFFHAEELRNAGNGDGVSFVRKENGSVVASVYVPAGATVPFVEGPIMGCMYKCVVHDPKTNAFEFAAAAK